MPIHYTDKTNVNRLSLLHAFTALLAYATLVYHITRRKNNLYKNKQYSYHAAMTLRIHDTARVTHTNNALKTQAIPLTSVPADPLGSLSLPASLVYVQHVQLMSA
jgi:hypothetical protein